MQDFFVTIIVHSLWSTVVFFFIYVYGRIQGQRIQKEIYVEVITQIVSLFSNQVRILPPRQRQPLARD